MGLFCHDGAHGQSSAISTNQIVCPVQQPLTPIVVVALPGVPGAPGGARNGTRIVCVPLDPKSIIYDATSGTIRFVGATFIDAVTPAGTIDGTNATFTLPSAPNPAASLELKRNGIYQDTTNITLTGAQIVFSAGSIPQPGDILVAHYRI